MLVFRFLGGCFAASPLTVSFLVLVLFCVVELSTRIVVMEDCGLVVDEADGLCFPFM